jgi:small subunit ribosomal protein S18
VCAVSAVRRAAAASAAPVPRLGWAAPAAAASLPSRIAVQQACLLSSSSSPPSRGSRDDTPAAEETDDDITRYYVGQDRAKVPFPPAVTRNVDSAFGTIPTWSRKKAKKSCMFCQMGKKHLVLRDEVWDPVNVPLWLRFLTPTGRILGKEVTGTCSKHQRKVARMIKRCRHMGFISYKEGYAVWSPFAMYRKRPEDDD